MSLAALLAERARRERDEARGGSARQAEYQAIADDLRAWYHPKQRAFLRSPAKRRAALCTRRSGKTAGICRELVARALELPGFRARYVNETREEAKGLAWRSDTKQGMVDILERLESEGRLTIAKERRDLRDGADVKIDEQALTIDFRNGSRLSIFAADDARSQERARGGAPHCVVVDEAQKYPRLRVFIEEILGPSVKDFDGELILAGTPAELCSGFFYDVSRNEDDASRAMREPGWETHEWSVRDNPWFGATEEERWERAIAQELRERHIDMDDPPAWVLREWFGRWTKTDARFVYSVHRWPAPVTYAPIRTSRLNVPLWLRSVNLDGKDPSGISGYIDRWYDHQEALRDLPVRDLWLFGLGVDFGYNPDPFAVHLWAFSPGLPSVYEMFSWKRTLVLPDYQRDCVRWFTDNLPGLVNIDADPGGQDGKHIAGWRELLGIPIEAAEKSAKRTWQEMLNNDGERGNIKLRDGSVTAHEMRHLSWLKKGDKQVEGDNVRLTDGTIPGRDCCDAALYSYRRWISRQRGEEAPPPPVETSEWYEREEDKMRKAAREQALVALVEQGEVDPDGLDWYA